MFLKHSRAGACSALEARLEDYLAGRLDSRQTTEVEVHVRACSRCAEALDRARAGAGLLAAVRARPLPMAGPHFVGRVMAEIRSERRDQELWKPLEVAGWELCWLAAAAALILAAFMLRIQMTGPTAPVDATAQQSQVQVLINVPVSQPAVQDDTLLVAAGNANGR